MIHHKHDFKAGQDRGANSDRGGRGRGGRGRGRGGRGGAENREHEDKNGEEEVKKVESVSEEGSLKSQQTSEKKLSLLFQFLNKFLAKKFKDGAFEGQSFIFLKVQQY